MKTETLEKAVQIKKNLDRYEYFNAKLKEARKLDIRFEGSEFILPSIELHNFIIEATKLYEENLNKVITGLKEQFENL